MKWKSPILLLMFSLVFLLGACNTSATTATPTGESVGATPTGESVGATPTEESVGATPTSEPATTDNPINSTFPGDLSKIFSVPFWEWPMAQWINLGISFLLFFVIARLGGRFISWVARQITKRTNTKVDDAFFAAIAQSVKWLGVVIGFQIAYKRLSFITDNWLELLENLTFVLYVVVFTVMIWQLINYFMVLVHTRAINKGADERSLNRVLPLLQTFVRTSLIIISFIITLHHFGIEITAMIAALGISGFALSLAAKDLLTNMISGVTIAVDRPFRLGDRIYSKDVDAWVDVEEIGIRSTQVRTRDNRVVVIPNSLLSDSSVINYNYPDRYFRLQVDIGVAYGTDFDKTRQVLGDAVRQVEGVMPGKPIQVLFVEFGDSAMIFRVRWWITDFAKMRAMNDRVYQALQEALINNEIVTPGPAYDVNYHFDKEEADRLAEAFKDHG
jgi:small-conductance mechanosensitive channel